jgi:hypothetical protein
VEEHYEGVPHVNVRCVVTAPQDRVSDALHGDTEGATHEANTVVTWSRNSVVGIATGYGPDD